MGPNGRIRSTLPSTPGTARLSPVGPGGHELQGGPYVNAEREASRTGSAPGIDVSGDGRSCNKAYGSFTVTQVTIGHSGKVLSLEATFEQHCESPGAPALRGYVKFAAG